MQPVFVLLDETIGHMSGKATLPDLEEVKAGIKLRKEFTGDPKDYKPYEVAQDEAAVLNPMFKGYRYHYTGLHHDANGHPTEDEKKMSRFNWKDFLIKWMLIWMKLIHTKSIC